MSDNVTETEFDALAAEYVLGTLDASERAHTHVLIGIDDGFAARVKMWERRLGELHLMVEPVEPDWRVYERVKARIGGFSANPFYAALGARMGEDGLPLPPPEVAQLPLGQAPQAAPSQVASTATDPNPASPQDHAPQQAASPQTPPSEADPAGLWDFAPSETAPPEPVMEQAAAGTATAAAVTTDSVPPEVVMSAAASPASEASAGPVPEPAAPVAPAIAGSAATATAVESPPLAAPLPTREPTVVDPKAAHPVAQLRESERTIPYAGIQGPGHLIVPAAQIARDVARSRRSARKWRAFDDPVGAVARGSGGGPAELPRAAAASGARAVSGAGRRACGRPLAPARAGPAGIAV
jgi:hypothetical protein